VEQRVYHGSVTPIELADYLVQQFDPQRDLQAQKMGEGDSLVVQIGRGASRRSCGTPSPWRSPALPTSSRAWPSRWGSSSG
jgi:hypothetical protein